MATQTTWCWVVSRHLNDLPRWLHWTAEQLAPSERDWLDRLPFSITFNPTADPGTALTVVHANPLDVNQILFPPEEDQQTRYGALRQPDAALDDLLTGMDAQLLAFGHLHIPSIRLWRDRVLLNVSSVNLSGDGDPRAKYAVATWDGGHWSAEHVRVAYDVPQEIEAYRLAQPPGWPEAVGAIEAEGTITATYLAISTKTWLPAPSKETPR